MMVNSTSVCRWCGRAFQRRGGGRVQRFCRPACRRALDAAGRRFVADALASGLLTVADLGTHPAATRAFATSTAAPLSDGGADTLLGDVLGALPDEAWYGFPEDILDRIGAWLGEGDE